MIGRVEKRLVVWSEQVRGGLGARPLESPFGALLRNGGVFAPPGKGCIVPIDDESMRVEAALRVLPPVLQELVVLYYLRELVLQACGKRLGVSEATASRYLDAAHVLLDVELFAGRGPKVA